MANHIPEIIISWPQDITKDNLAQIHHLQVSGRSRQTSVAQIMFDEVTSPTFILKPFETLEGFDLDIPFSSTDKKGVSGRDFGLMCLTIVNRFLAYTTAPGVILYAEKISLGEEAPTAIPALEALRSHLYPLVGFEQPADLDPERIVTEVEEFYNRTLIAQLLKEYPDPIEFVGEWVTSRIDYYSEQKLHQLIPDVFAGQRRFSTLYLASLVDYKRKGRTTI